MLKTVKNGCGIRVDPPPCFFKIPTFSRNFFWGASLSCMPLTTLTDRPTDRLCSLLWPPGWLVRRRMWRLWHGTATPTISTIQLFPSVLFCRGVINYWTWRLWEFVESLDWLDGRPWEKQCRGTSAGCCSSPQRSGCCRQEGKTWGSSGTLCQQGQRGRLPALGLLREETWRVVSPLIKGSSKPAPGQEPRRRMKTLGCSCWSSWMNRRQRWRLGGWEVGGSSARGKENWIEMKGAGQFTIGTIYPYIFVKNIKLN